MLNPIITNVCYNTKEYLKKYYCINERKELTFYEFNEKYDDIFTCLLTDISKCIINNISVVMVKFKTNKKKDYEYRLCEVYTDADVLPTIIFDFGE